MLSTEEISDLIIHATDTLPLPEQPAGLYRPIRYAISCGGKRLRPNLLLHAVQACGGDAVSAINQAMAIEMFHNFTLVHDDVMDNADVRRGQLTVHRRWSSDQAILSGDAMLTEAMMLLVNGCPQDVLAKVVDVFNRTAMGVYEGQQLDMDFENRMDVTTDEYLQMIRLKTAVLLAGACRIGAILGGAGAETERAFADYAENLGIAFQLRDDWLDAFGDPVYFGKEIGGDIVNGKKTWLLIEAMNRSGAAVSEIYAAKLQPDIKVEKMLEVYNSLDLSARASELIGQYAERAVSALSRLDINDDDRQYFMDLARDSATRAY